MPTLALIGILVAVVALGKFGQTPGEVATPIASRAPVPSVRRAGAAATLSVLHRPVYNTAANLIGLPVGIRSDSDTYDDGIPAVWEGEPVLRARDAAALPNGSVALVAGWTRRTGCSGEEGGQCSALLSDVPFHSPRTAALVLGGAADYDYREGPRIYRASVQLDPGCTFSAFDACLPMLDVGSALWEGDEQTATGPVSADALLEALAMRFPALDFRAFEEASSCPVTWPMQSYLASRADVPRALSPSLPIRLVVVYPDVSELLSASFDLRTSAAAMTPFDASNRCVSIPGGVDNAAWVVRDNAMILLGPDDAAVRATVSAAIVEGEAAAQAD